MTSTRLESLKDNRTTPTPAQMQQALGENNLLEHVLPNMLSEDGQGFDDFFYNATMVMDPHRIDYYLYRAMMECGEEQPVAEDNFIFETAYWIAVDALSDQDPLTKAQMYKEQAGLYTFAPDTMAFFPLRPMHEQVIMVSVGWLLKHSAQTDPVVKPFVDWIFTTYGSTPFARCMEKQFEPLSSYVPKVQPKKAGRKTSPLFLNNEDEQLWSERFVAFLAKHNRSSAEITSSAQDFTLRHLVCFLRKWQSMKLLPAGNPNFAAAYRFIETCQLKIKGVDSNTLKNKIGALYNGKSDGEDTIRVEEFIREIEQK